MSDSNKPVRVLFVCLGNICRSPAAEIIFRRFVSDEGLDGSYQIDSAGTIGHHQGAPPDPRMAERLKHHGFEISGRARRILPSDLDAFDLIVTMDESNLEHVRDLDPDGKSHAKIRPLTSFCSEHDDPRVPDPYYGGQRGFDHVISLLQDGCRGILRETRPD